LLSAIVGFSLRHRGVAIALAIALVAYGIFRLRRAKYDVFPGFAPPLVSILTEAPGLSAEQVELLVTLPIEYAVNGVEGVQSLRSMSTQGVSSISVVFRPGSAIYLDRQLVAERLARVAGQLPQGVSAPEMTPLTSSTNVVLVAGLSSKRQSLMTLRTIADWTVRPRLLSVPGVAKVPIWGGEVKQFQVQLGRQRLVQYDLTVDDILAVAHRATGVRGAGFIDTPNQRLILQSAGEPLTAAQLAGVVVVHRNGANVTLGDVARVKEAAAPAIGAAAVMGQPAVALVVSEQYGANTLEVTGRVERALEELQPGLARQGIDLHMDLFRPANFIDTALHNIRSSLVIGAVLVVAVLVLFLFNFRTAAISCTAIPVSLLTAVTVLDRLGFTLNIMTLGGLAIAIGEVVDDAVIDVENILRRLRENRHSADPRPAIRVIFDASIEVRSAVVYATFAVALVFIPILTMSGVAGRIFAPLGMAYIFSILASLLVALTLTPALSLVFLGRGRFQQKEPPLARWLKRGYRSLLLGVGRFPHLMIAAVVVTAGLGLALLPSFHESFLPQLKEGHFIVHMRPIPGTSLSEALRMGRHVTELLERIPFVRMISQRAGRAVGSEDILATQNSEIEVDLKHVTARESELAEPDIRKAIAEVPGPSFVVNTFLAERIEETVSGYTASVVVNVFGQNLDVLDRKAREVERILAGVRGAAGLQLLSPPGTPQVTVQLRPADLLRWGFDPITVLDGIQTAFGGKTVGQVYQGNRVFDVAVILGSRDRASVADIRALALRSPSGDYVPLWQLADIRVVSGRSIIQHEGGRRVETITCDVTGRTSSSFVREARSRILSGVKFPPGTYVEFTGTAAAAARSRNDLLLHSLLAGLGIVVLLSIVMRNYRNLILVLLNLPFALLGGVLAVYVTGSVLSLGSLVAFVTLFGITLRNSIMLVSHFEHLVEAEGMSWGLDAAMRGASERLLPILMTATVTGLGLLPLALGSGAPGREIEGPMAIVILGGLFTSTALNLLVLPTLALRYGSFEATRPEL
jgi:CzcA family heavy metal efflux pump